MSDLRRGIDALIAVAAERMATLAASFRAGEITAAQWQQAQMAQIKAVHVAASLAAYGGRAAMTQARWGVVGQVVRQQYQFQRQFLTDVLEGRQRQNGRLDTRARLYASAARVTYANIQRREQAAAGMRYERNEIGGGETCAACMAQSTLGWVPIGTLSPIGSRTCRSNCQCEIVYSTTYLPAAVAS